MEILSSDRRGEDGDWVSIADMMSGLMIVFMFISVVYMIQQKAKQDQIKTIAVTYQQMQQDLHTKLSSEFSDLVDMKIVKIDRDTLSVNFIEPDVLFEAGRATLRPRFIELLDDFFPRYLEIIYSEQFRPNIEEVRIEGHTSSDFGSLSGDAAYFLNMELSQDRTRTVLEYVLTKATVPDQSLWLRERISANGLSSSKRILSPNCASMADVALCEDRAASRRVTFRTKTAAESRIVQIVDELTSGE